MKHLHFNALSSTNTFLKAHYQTLDHLTWVRADYQTEGRGRSQPSWFGSLDSLMCSVLIKSDLSIDLIFRLPLLAATSLHKVLTNYASQVMIKWPNDLLIDGKKLSGILTESQVSYNEVHAIIIGFGININHTTFDPSIRETATSLHLETKLTYDSMEIYQRLVNQFQEDLESFHKDPQFVIDYCNQYHALKNQSITYIKAQDTYHGTVLSIDPQGHLQVQTDYGIDTLSSGEVTLKKIAQNPNI